MEFGIAIFPTDRTMRIDDLAAEVEARGYGALFVTEHTHIPVDHSPFPRGGPLPDRYKRTLDPWVALTAAASTTTDLKLGTGVTLLAQHHPITLAKRIATLDLISGGRVIVGVGYGWNRPETEHHGVAFGDRRAYLHESLEAMKQLWTREQAEFHGEHVEFAPSYSWPKPVQQPHPPIWLGAKLGPRGRAAVVEHCDGWLPIGGSGLEQDIPALRRAAEEAGRDPDTIAIHVYGTEADVDKLRFFEQLGVEGAFFYLPSAERDEVIPALDQITKVVEELR